jgi:DNA-binding response OmpR family regulator
MHPMDIVLADDDRFSRESLLRTLQDRTEHTITAVADGHLALECALSQRPDALILDWMMPTMTGTEVCRRIRSADLVRQPYVLVVTARNQREDLLEGLSAGVDDLLSKPVAPDLLIARLAAAERQRKARRSSTAIVLQALRSAQAEGDGELVVRDGVTTARVHFHRGAVAWAHLSDDRNALFEILASEPTVEPEIARAIVEECRRSGARLSDTLVRWGLTDRADLRNSVQVWIRKKIDAIVSFEHPEALFLPQRRPYAEDMLFDLEELLPPARESNLEVPASTAADGKSVEGRSAGWADAFVEGEVPSELGPILDRCMKNDGIRGVAILNRETGVCLGQRGAPLNATIAWTYLQTLNVIARHEPVEDAVVTTSSNHHLVCFMPQWRNCFAYAVVDAQRIMLATARFQLKRALQG